MELKAENNKTKIGDIPGEWECLPLGKLFTFKNGLNKEKEYFGHGTPIINYNDVYLKSEINGNDILGRVSLTSKEIKLFEVMKGDVFFTRTSETPNEIGISSVLMDDTKDTVFSGFVLRARSINEVLDLRFKKYCFSSETVRKEIISNCTYTTRALTNGRVLSKIFMLIPPFPEQQAIATALSDIDSLINSLTKLINKKKSIKQGAMQELLTGKRRLEGYIGGYKRTEVGVIPENWACTVLTDDYVSIDNDNLKSDTPRDYRFKYISLENINKGKLIGSTEQSFSNAPSRARRKLQEGDIMIGTVRPNLMSHYYVSRDVKNYICSTGFSVVRTKPDKLCGEYLYHHLFAGIVNRQIEKILVGSSYPAINSKDIKQLLFPIPPVNEQKVIAAVLTNMDTEIDLLEKKLNKFNNIKQGMMQELLTGRIRLLGEVAQ